MGAHDWVILPTQHLSPHPSLPRTADSLRSGLWSRPSHRPQASCPVPAGFNCTECWRAANHSDPHYRSSSSRGGNGEERQACSLDLGCLQAPSPPASSEALGPRGVLVHRSLVSYPLPAPSLVTQ
uniref:Uncharacterized protein n=1 Tax=Rousettus aegyptiacus TaxID=9407 RepID=A0A7J8H1G3_ROUAE|nr:hypothetical protein HJG63_011201 [Rousettus aegyptiacus]